MADRRIRAAQVANQRADTPADIAERKYRYAVLQQVREERQGKFPVITMANVDAALKWQEARISELMSRATDHG